MIPNKKNVFWNLFLFLASMVVALLLCEIVVRVMSLALEVGLFRISCDTDFICISMD